MPTNVRRFEWLMYISLVLGIVNAILQYPAFSARIPGAFIIFIQAFVVAFFVLFIWLIARKRQNWARWIFVIFFVLGLPVYALGFTDLLQRTPAAALIGLVQLALQLGAVIFIFTGDAKPWFRRDVAD